MSSSENDQQTELLKSIAASLKGIHSSIESLTAAVEDVSETIEKAHEPEGDLGVHLVGALKDLVSALHKKANQERSSQPQHQNQQRHQHQPRRDHQRQRPEEQPDRLGESTGEPGEDRDESGVGAADRPAESEIPSTAEAPGESKGGNRRRPRGRRPGKTPADKA